MIIMVVVMQEEVSVLIIPMPQEVSVLTILTQAEVRGRKFLLVAGVGEVGGRSSNHIGKRKKKIGEKDEEDLLADQPPGILN